MWVHSDCQFRHGDYRSLLPERAQHFVMPDSISNSPGPDPSTLETHDHVPAGIKPVSLRVTYTESKLSDYVALKRSNGVLCLELGPPLFGIVSKAGKLNELKTELKEALAAIGLSEIVSHFSDTVMKYTLDLFPHDPLPGAVGLGAATYLLKKLWERGKLMLGYIHHASIDELSSWMGLIEQAKQNPDISVNAGEIVLSD